MSAAASPLTHGVCSHHGTFVGSHCPKCAEIKASAALTQAVWEASQFMAYDEIRAYVETTLREIESDEP